MWMAAETNESVLGHCPEPSQIECSHHHRVGSGQLAQNTARSLS
jgi:hypothetical protein